MRLLVRQNKFIFDGLPFHRKEEARAVGAYWSGAKRVWTCPANIISAVGIMSMSDNNGSTDDLSELDDWMKELYASIEKAEQGIPPGGSQCVLKNKPMPHQEVGTLRVRYQKRLGLWWDMGVGKTFSALWVAQDNFVFGGRGKVLVCCPLSLVSTWTDEMEKHLSRPYRVHILAGTPAKRKKAIEAWKKTPQAIFHFALTSWDTLARIEPELRDIQVDFLIGDETGFIKNRSAQRTKAAIAVADRAEYVVALNGTPYVSDVRDLWSQMRFVGEQYAGSSFWRFANRYVMFDNSPWHRPIGLKPEMKPELKRLMDVVGMTVKKEDVLKDLPPKTNQIRKVTARGDQKKALDNAMNEFSFAVEAVRKGAHNKTKEIVLIRNAMARATKVQQIAMGWTKNEHGNIIRFKDNPKRDAILDLSQEIPDKPFVVFSRFVEDLEIIKEGVEKIGRKPALYHGQMPVKKAEESKQRFMTGKADVFISQVQKGGFGLNLQMASTGSFLTNWWSYGVRQQAEGRLHRKGQTDPVLYVDVLMEDSVDQGIFESFKRGTSLVNYLFGRDMTDKDMEAAS